MKVLKKLTVLLFSVILAAGAYVGLGSFAVVGKKVYADSEEVLSMSGLVSEEVGVNGAELDKNLVKAQLVHGNWGSYRAFDGMNNVDPDDEDQIYATDSVAQRGDTQGISTYIKRYQISATTNNDAVVKFVFKQDARFYLVHGTFGGDFNNNWATHAAWILVQETAEGAVVIKDMPAQGVTADNMYACDVHGKAGDVIYLIYRMKGNTPVPGHNYANMFFDCSFVFKTADYLLSERDRIFAASERIYKEETYSMSSLVTEEVGSGISAKLLADVSLVHGRFGEYHAFDGKHDATPDDEDQIYATDSVAQRGDTQDISTYIKRYQISATKKNDAVFKFVFKSNAKLYINHGTFGDGFTDNWATHACFLIVQQTADGAYTVKETDALATTVPDMFSGEVNGKVGDTVYVIYRMKSATTVPGHEYANVFLDFSFVLKEKDYVESDRASVLVDENIYVEKIYVDDEKFAMSSIVSEVVRNKKVTKDAADIELLHGKYGNYEEFDTFYDAIEAGNANWDEDKVSDSHSLAKNGSGMELATYFNRYKIGATKDNDAVIKFTFKENLKLKVTHGEGFWKTWATHARFYVVQVDNENNSTNIMIKNIVSNIPSNEYSFDIDAKSGDTVYLIYRMVGETTIQGCEYANVGIDFNFEISVNEYNETRRAHCFANSVEDFPYEGPGTPDIEAPGDITIENSSNKRQDKGCSGAVISNAFGFIVASISVCVALLLKKKGLGRCKRQKIGSK